MKKKPYSDKRWTEPIYGVTPKCYDCKNLIDKKLADYCKAFPNEKIPAEIQLEEDVSKLKNCNNGIGFEQI